MQQLMVGTCRISKLRTPYAYQAKCNNWRRTPQHSRNVLPKNAFATPFDRRDFVLVKRLDTRPSLCQNIPQWHGLTVETLLRRRVFSTSALATYLTPPAVFLGLVVTLWAYKCLMMIIFQNKIIYMPSVPPFSRSEKIEDYAKECRPVKWREEKMKSTDGTKISLAVGSCAPTDLRSRKGTSTGPATHLIIVYFQGNASSLPPRLPLLSAVIREACSASPHLSITLAALSYRGFWTSSGRPSQSGIEKDAKAALLWAGDLQQQLDRGAGNTRIILWGQSIGAGVAMQATANLLTEAGNKSLAARPIVDAIMLETPFLSIRDMLIGLYPQKWLPYRYLWPFLWNWWDTPKAVEKMSEWDCRPKLLVVDAEKDEVVPPEQGVRLGRMMLEGGFDVETVRVGGALHHEAMQKGEGRQAVISFLGRVGSH